MIRPSQIAAVFCRCMGFQIIIVQGLDRLYKKEMYLRRNHVNSYKLILVI